MIDSLPPDFPHIVGTSRRQMRDIGFVAQLCLIETGPQTLSQDDLDEAYASRDDSWDNKQSAERALRAAFQSIAAILDEDSTLISSRLRNQADFYSLVGAVHEMRAAKELPPPHDVAPRLEAFVDAVSSETSREVDGDAAAYYEAARSASNDSRQRRTRVEI